MLENLKKENYNLRFQKKNGQLEKMGRIDQVKKDIARVKTKLNKEMMKLYKDGGVNPIGGCLPMVLQMPILFALYTVFSSTIELRG